MIVRRDNSIGVIDGSIATYSFTTGGIIRYDIGSVIHIFNHDDYFITDRHLDASVLLVGGGGDGCIYDGWSGGAGGGGKVKLVNMSINPGSHFVKIGKHNPSTNYTTLGTTTFNGVDASPGLAGNAWISGASGSGFVGGGAHFDITGGGGGGEYSNGEGGSAQNAGEGGAGYLCNITGELIGYGGGGGGGTFYATSSYPNCIGYGTDGGGTGRSDAYSNNNLAQPGYPNTGGGAGGGSSPYDWTDKYFQIGADGVVIIRYSTNNSPYINIPFITDGLVDRWGWESSKSFYNRSFTGTATYNVLDAGKSNNALRSMQTYQDVSTRHDASILSAWNNDHDFSIAIWLKNGVDGELIMLTSNATTFNAGIMIKQYGISYPTSTKTIKSGMTCPEVADYLVGGNIICPGLEWHLVVLTRQNNVWTQYIDNKFDASMYADVYGYSNKSDITIHGDNFNTRLYVGPFYIYNRALSTDEISFLWHNGFGA